MRANRAHEHYIIEEIDAMDAMPKGWAQRQMAARGRANDKPGAPLRPHQGVSQICQESPQQPRRSSDSAPTYALVRYCSALTEAMHPGMHCDDVVPKVLRLYEP